jgi:lipoprotein signal peptidase
VSADPSAEAARPARGVILCHPLWLGLGVALLAGGVDRLSKWWLVDVFGLPGHPPVQLGPMLNLVMVWNRGVSFGLLAGDADWHRAPLVGFALVVAAVLLVALLRTRSTWMAIALGLVIGGAVSNAWDRVTYGAVADFIDFHIGGYHWYTFNVADAAITVGAVLLIVDGLFRGGGQHR